MSEEYDQQAEIARLAERLNSLITIWDPERLLPNEGLPAKIDVLERAIEAWRYQTSKPENRLSLEDFSQCKLLVDADRIIIQAPDCWSDLGTGTPPIHFQPRLLLFLLLYHRRRYEVLDIIRLFVERVRGQLTLLDFKKTETGVTRCFTNIRFAANVLRDYGLLKYTQREAYKTWVLSLPGFLVASRLLDHEIKWTLPRVQREQNFDLHDDIRWVWARLDGYEDFVDQLARVCEPNVEVFSTFRDVLNVAYRMLPGYWKVMNDPELSQKKRRVETMQRLQAIDEQPRMAEFYREFSASVNVERLLKEVDDTA